MKKEFESKGGKTEHKPTVYNLLYDKERAIALYNECTEQYKKDFEENWGKNGIEPKNLKKLFAKILASGLFVVTCCIFVFVFLMNDAVWGTGIASILGLMSFAFSVFWGMEIKELSEDIAFKNMQYQNNEGVYEYPLLVRFHQVVGDNEIIGVSLRDERTDGELTLRVSYKTPSGECERKKFYVHKKVSSFAVTQIEIDLENDVVRFPAKSKKPSFLINGRSEACE